MSKLPTETVTDDSQPPDPPVAALLCDQLVFNVPAAGLVLGRKPHGAGTIDDRKVSGTHALITLHQGELQVRDLGSRNGTYVNGVAVAFAPLSDGDQLRVGATVFTVRIPAPDRVASHGSTDRGRGGQKQLNLGSPHAAEAREGDQEPTPPPDPVDQLLAAWWKKAGPTNEMRVHYANRMLRRRVPPEHRARSDRWLAEQDARRWAPGFGFFRQLREARNALEHEHGSGNPPSPKQLQLLLAQLEEYLRALPGEAIDWYLRDSWPQPTR
jgi:predicted component of type VI protein secretion system